MPYIKQESRDKFQAQAKLLGDFADCAGDLNYIITEMVHQYIRNKGLRYSNINEVIGALECCKLELYRKLAAPYEDTKIKENGDVGLNEGSKVTDEDKTKALIEAEVKPIKDRLQNLEWRSVP